MIRIEHSQSYSTRWYIAVTLSWLGVDVRRKNTWLLHYGVKTSSVLGEKSHEIRSFMYEITTTSYWPSNEFFILI